MSHSYVGHIRIRFSEYKHLEALELAKHCAPSMVIGQKCRVGLQGQAIVHEDIIYASSCVAEKRGSSPKAKH
jgi:hypothetical protein